jgi:hypothetical protein
VPVKVTGAVLGLSFNRVLGEVLFEHVGFFRRSLDAIVRVGSPQRRTGEHSTALAAARIKAWRVFTDVFIMIFFRLLMLFVCRKFVCDSRPLPIANAATLLPYLPIHSEKRFLWGTLPRMGDGR